MEGLKAEGPALPQEPQLQQILNTASELKLGFSPQDRRGACAALTDVSGHLTWPCPPAAPSSCQPHPTSHCCNFPLWGKQCCHCSWKSQLRLQARSRVVKKPNYFSDGSLTGTLKPTRRTHEHPPSTTIFGVLIFWMFSFLHLRWRMFMLPPVKDLWSHLQTLTAPGLPDTLCLPFIPTAWSSKEGPAPFSVSSCEEKPSCTLLCCCQKSSRYHSCTFL